MGNDGPKYLQIYRSLREKIDGGTHEIGSRLPSELELAQMYGTSRVTVSRALNELRSEGRIDRRVGSGTYVTGSAPKGYAFGLLIPDLGQTEVFEPICQGMMAVQEGQKHILIWGKSLTGSEINKSEAVDACRALISNKVTGVFFAPLEANSHSSAANRAIADLLSEAKVPTVLLDRDIEDYPKRSRFDLVGIDNRRAGYVATQHLVHAGCRRVGFIGHQHLAPSCIARCRGYRDALAESGADQGSGFEELIDPSDRARVAAVVEQRHPDGLVCANDRTAAELMWALNDLGVAVPHDVRLVAFDDVNYAHLVAVPLTTIHQPCAALGAAALRAMVERVHEPDMPARDILVDFRLVVRESSGTKATANGAYPPPVARQ